MLGNYLQQTTSADEILLLGTLRVKDGQTVRTPGYEIPHNAVYCIMSESAVTVLAKRNFLALSLFFNFLHAV